MLKLLAFLGWWVQLLIPSAHAQSTNLPACDAANPQVQIIHTDADMAHLNDSNKTIFCVFPGNYNPVTLTRDGAATAPRILRYYTGNQDFISPWKQSTSSQAVIERIRLSADYWNINGIVVRPDSGNEGVIYPLDINGSNNVIDNILNEKGHMLVAFRTGDNNTIQNSVIRSSMRRNTIDHPGDEDSYCIINTRATHTHILNNEIYDCTDGVQQLRNSDWTTYPVWSPDGLDIEDNEIYQTGALYANCSNTDPNTSLDPNGACSCAEDGIDIKTSTTNNPVSPTDLMIIRNNILYGFRKTHPTCGGSGSYSSGIDLHIDSPTYILVEDNLFYDMPQGMDFTSVNKVTVRNNLLVNINDRGVGQGSVAFLAHSGQATEIYHNSVIDTLGNAIYLNHNPSATNFDIRSNLFVNAGVSKATVGGFGSSSQVGYNGFYGSPSFNNVLASSTNKTGTTAQAILGGNYCVTVHKFTTPSSRCFPNVQPQAGSPTLSGGDPNLGSRVGIGIDNITIPGGFLGKFDLVPTILQLIANWLTSNFDQNGDGIVNSLDFASLW